MNQNKDDSSVSARAQPSDEKPPWVILVTVLVMFALIGCFVVYSIKKKR